MDGAVPAASRAGSDGRVRLLLDQRLQVEHLEDPVEADQRGHHLDLHVGQRPDRPVDAGEQLGERDQRAELERAVDHQAAADAVDDGGEQPGEQGDRDHEHGPVHVPGDADLADLERLGGEQLRLLARAAVELGEHRARHVEPLGHRGAHLGVELHGLPRQALQAAAEPAGGEDEQRDQQQADQADQPGQVEQGDQDDDQRQDVGQHAGQRADDRLLRADHVPVEPADQRPGLRAGEERQRLPLHVVEDLGAQVVDEALADPRGEVAVHHAEERVEQR